MRLKNPNAYVKAWENQPVPRNQLIHLAGVYDGTAEIRFYVNGQLQSRTPAQNIRPSNVPLTLGGNWHGDTDGSRFLGRLNEVRISKVARYDSDFTPNQRFEPDNDTIALYHFDEGQGTVLTDSSGNGHHGEIVGAKWVKADRPPPLAVVPFDAAQAKQHQEAWGKHLGMPVETTNSIGMKLRLIPPGEFMMGSLPDEIPEAVEQAAASGIARAFVENVENSGLPQHKVGLSQPYLMGTCEVTVGQFRRFVKETGHRTTVEKKAKANWQAPGWDLSENQPASHISWDDVRAFCRWLGRREGALTNCLPSAMGVRLPGRLTGPVVVRGRRLVAQRLRLVWPG